MAERKIGVLERKAIAYGERLVEAQRGVRKYEAAQRHAAIAMRRAADRLLHKSRQLPRDN